jgi:hypothetical protein
MVPPAPHARASGAIAPIRTESLPICGLRCQETADPTASTESIAVRDGCSVRKVNMTISLAFLAPDLVKAAIEGRLPHGMGVVRLADLPAEWSRQHQMLGLPMQ